MAKAMKARNGIELRIAVRGRSVVDREEAIRELERRRGNLLGAVIPQWELEARGPNPAKWELV